VPLGGCQELYFGVRTDYINRELLYVGNIILLRLNWPDDFPGCDSLRRMAKGVAVCILSV
jgi:hypothetical protein